MTVMAWLDGRPGDLAALARHFTDDPAVRSDNGEDYYLTSAAFDALWSDVSRLREAASSQLVRINGAARVLDPAFRPVRLRERYDDSEGRGHVVLIGTAIETSTAFGILTVSVNGVPQVPPPSPAPDLARLADQHPDVAEVFELMADPESLDWFVLYKVYEIVRENVGGKANLVRNGWITQSELLGFLNSSNTASISGADARHARGTPQSTDTMDVTEARVVISKLARYWLDSL